MAAPASPAVPTPRRRRTANTPTTYRTSAIRPLTTASECTNVTVGIARLSRPPPSSGSGRQVGAECAPPRSANADVSPRAGAAASAGASTGRRQCGSPARRSTLGLGALLLLCYATHLVPFALAVLFVTVTGVVSAAVERRAGDPHWRRSTAAETTP